MQSYKEGKRGVSEPVKYEEAELIIMPYCFECTSSRLKKIDENEYECLNCGIYITIHEKECDCLDCEEQKFELKKLEAKFQKE